MEEKNNHSPITIGNAVIKTDKKFFDSAKKVIRKEGFGSLIKKTSRALYDTVRRFVREYIPLKYHYKRSSDGQVVRKVQDSFMFLDLRDTGISRELTLYGVHEKNSTAAIKRILKPGMKILECGANIGYYAMLEGRLVGPTGKIYAVEPSPKNIAWLTRNIAINNYEHIEVIPGAFGAEKGTAPFYVDIRSNLSSFVKRDDLTEYEVVDVEMMNIDSFMALPDHDVDLIRMDVEGYETEILKGGEKILMSDRAPKYFFIEVHSELLKKRGSGGWEIAKYLRQFGYEVDIGFHRGSSRYVVMSMKEFEEHPMREVGYWEIFFRLDRQK